VICYEWVIEYLDADGEDIEELIHADTFKQAAAYIEMAVAKGVRVDIALTRKAGDEVEGLTERQYAYLNNDCLPPDFDGGAKVPKRFAEQVEKVLGRKDSAATI
jgi:hypothetical protein